MPPKKDVKCYNRTAKSGATYTTCKDKKTGKQLRKGERPSASPPKPKAKPKAKSPPKPKPKAKSPPKSELEQRIGKSRKEINKMEPIDVIKGLPLELRQKIGNMAIKTEIVNGFVVPKRGVKLTMGDFWNNDKVGEDMSKTRSVFNADKLKRFVRSVISGARVGSYTLSRMVDLVKTDRKIKNANITPFLRNLAENNKKPGPFDKKQMEKARKQKEREEVEKLKREQARERGKTFHTWRSLELLLNTNPDNNTYKYVLQQIMDFDIGRSRRSLGSRFGRDESDTYSWVKDGKDKAKVVEAFMDKELEKMNIRKTDSLDEIKKKVKQLGDIGKAYVKRKGYKRQVVSSTMYYDFD